MERSIMIQYTGTSSRSNYNDERTATIGRPSELLRRLGVGSSSTFFPPSVFLSAPPHRRRRRLLALLSLLFLDPLRLDRSSRSCPPLLVLLLLHLLLLLVLPYSRRSLRRILAPQQEQTSPRGRHGATESRWMDLSLSLSRYSGIITGATARVHLAGSASSAGYVLDETILTELHRESEREAGLYLDGVGG